jgi:hypothetical protein
VTVSTANASVTVGESGSVVIDLLKPGEVSVAASREGYFDWSGTATVEAEATGSLSVTMKRQYSAARVVVTDGTSPLTGAEVYLHGQTVTTGKDGVALFEDVPTGTYSASVSCDLYDDSSTSVPVVYGSTSEKTVALARSTGNVSVWIQEGASGYAIGTGGKMSLNGVTVDIDSGGKADFTSVPTGTYTAVTDCPCYAAGSVSVTVTKGRALDTRFIGGSSIPLRLNRLTATTVTFTFLKGNGSPLVGATVSISLIANGTTFSFSYVTDSNGKFTEKAVPNGSYDILVSPANGLYPMRFTAIVSGSGAVIMSSLSSSWWT